jgi:hypothetical protein
LSNGTIFIDLNDFSYFKYLLSIWVEMVDIGHECQQLNSKINHTHQCMSMKFYIFAGSKWNLTAVSALVNNYYLSNDFIVNDFIKTTMFTLHLLRKI